MIKITAFVIATLSILAVPASARDLTRGLHLPADKSKPLVIAVPNNAQCVDSITEAIGTDPRFEARVLAKQLRAKGYEHVSVVETAGDQPESAANTSVVKLTGCPDS